MRLRRTNQRFSSKLSMGLPFPSVHWEGIFKVCYGGGGTKPGDQEFRRRRNERGILKLRRSLLPCCRPGSSQSCPSLYRGEFRTCRGGRKRGIWGIEAATGLGHFDWRPRSRTCPVMVIPATNFVFGVFHTGISLRRKLAAMLCGQNRVRRDMLVS